MKARATLDQATLKYAFDDGENPECGYIKGNTSYILKECSNLYNSFKKSLNVVKICDSNAYANGCIPDYAGNDTINKANHPNMSDEDAVQATEGCHGWNKSNIRSGMAMVLADGMILFPYGRFDAPIIAVDVNGQVGPNKWGHDIHSFLLKMSETSSQLNWDAYYSGCEPIEKGGVSTKTLLYGKNYE